ncbi:hypothetical protein Drorol1_Dr00019725 [Drosera rotundifolia]
MKPDAEDELKDTQNPNSWSREQDKAFENAIAKYPVEEGEEKWEKIAGEVEGKTVEEVKRHYELLVEDLESIESGCVPIPSYAEGCGGAGKGSKSEQERRKGIAWTEDEHRQFLLGLDKYGKGDWRSISRNFVVTRTPTQVASHAQKYFIRLDSKNKDRRRSSIHDITTVNDGDVAASQGPITGQNNSATAAAPASSKPSKQPLQPPPAGTVIGTPTMGQPIGGPLVSAVGTPVNLAPPHLAYGMRAPVPGTVVPGAPVSMAPMPYPIPHTAAHSSTNHFSLSKSLFIIYITNHISLTLSLLALHFLLHIAQIINHNQDHINMKRSALAIEDTPLAAVNHQQLQRTPKRLQQTAAQLQQGKSFSTQFALLRLGPKITETVRGKLSLGVRILQYGGVEKIFRRVFSVREGEVLLKASQCNLFTTAGPIAGLIFVSTDRVAFCSDRSIKFSPATTGDSIRFHYKVMIPLRKITRANQSENVKKPTQKYLQLVTTDDYEFWFTGIPNYKKTFQCLQQAIFQAS